MSMMVSFCAILVPQDVLDEILNLIESVSEGFPSYSYLRQCTDYIHSREIEKLHFFNGKYMRYC